MYLKMLAVYTMDHLLSLNYADTAARKRAHLQMTLPFRISAVQDKQKHDKMVRKGIPALNPMRFQEYEELLDAQQEPLPLTVFVRYDHAQAAAFVKSIQEAIHEQNPAHPLNLLESQMLHP